MVAYNSCWSSRDRLRGSQWADGKLSVSLHGLVRLYLVCGCLVGGGKKRIFECLTTVDIGIVSIHWSSGCWITLPTLSLDTRARIFPCVSMEVHFVQMFQSNWDAVRGWRRGLVMIKRWRKIDVNAGKNGRNWVAEMRNGKRGEGWSLSLQWLPIGANGMHACMWRGKVQTARDAVRFPKKPFCRQWTRFRIITMKHILSTRRPIGSCNAYARARVCVSVVQIIFFCKGLKSYFRFSAYLYNKSRGCFCLFSDGFHSFLFPCEFST